MSTVDRIREQLAHEGGVAAEAMEPLALAYGLDVAQLNERLAICVRLLRKGLRSEAIQQANIRPNLFDWSSNLDFPEVDEWLEILQFYQITLPARLNRDAVQQLQEALVEEQPLEDLLRQHRRLAIGKAPLGWRLKVLRAIASLDPSNGIWVEDVEIWESARLREIPTELASSIKEVDFAACSKLASELNQKSWIVQPPQELIASATKASNSLEFAAQCRELEAIGKSLYDCFCSQNQLECQTFLSQWNDLTSQLKAPVPKAIYETVEPALLWMQELDEQSANEESHKRAVANLVVQLDEGRSMLDIQKAYQIASSSGCDLDPSLESRYRSVTSELALAAKRRSILSVVGIASLAILAALAFGVWQWRSMKQVELASSLHAMQQLLDNRKLREAKQFIDNLKTTKPALVATSEMTALASDLDGRIQAETDRLQSFENYIKEADNESAEYIDTSNLVRAEELASTDAEKERVYRIRRRKQDHDRAESDKQFSLHGSELTAIVNDLDGLEKKKRGELSEHDFEIQLSRLSEVVSKYPNVGSDGDALVATVRKRLTTLRDAYSQSVLNERQEIAALETIRSAKTLNAFRQALLSFATAFPNSSLSAEFKEAAGEYDKWPIVDEWNRFVEGLGELSHATTPELAIKVSEALKALKAKLDGCPALSRCPDVEARLASVVRRTEALKTLQSDLDRDPISALITLRGRMQSSADQEIRVFAYFNHIDPKRKALESASSKAGNGLEIVDGDDGTVKVASFLGPLKVIDQPKDTYEELVATLRLREKSIIDEWESPLLILVNDIMKRPLVDSTMKEMLITQLLATASEGSYFLKQNLDEILTLLHQRRTLHNHWYAAQPVRDQIDTEFENRLRTTLSDTYRGLAASNKTLKHLSSAKLTWVGLLQRDTSGRIDPWITELPSTSGVLIVVRESASKPGSVRLDEVGQVADGAVKLTATSASLIAGRPLFFMPSN